MLALSDDSFDEYAIQCATTGKTGKKIKYLDLKIQTASDEAMWSVCLFSPEKGLYFHESQLKDQPLHITATQKSPKRLGISFNEYTVGKKSKILSA